MSVVLLFKFFSMGKNESAWLSPAMEDDLRASLLRDKSLKGSEHLDRNKALLLGKGTEHEAETVGQAANRGLSKEYAEDLGLPKVVVRTHEKISSVVSNGQLAELLK